MKNLLLCTVSGLLFGFGLALSGMTNPQTVLGFLTIDSSWNPTLMFVMGGALTVTIPAFHFILKRQSPLWGKTFNLPTRTHIDTPLIVGAALFGVGWGISGLCPGPAIANLAIASTDLLIFVGMMVVGFIIAQQISNKSAR